MIQKLRNSPAPILTVVALAIASWMTADAVTASPGDKASSSRSGSSASRSSSSSSSGSSSATVSAGSGSSSRQAVPRSGSSRSGSVRSSASSRAHGGSGAARTRTRHDRSRSTSRHGGHYRGHGYYRHSYGYGFGFGYGYPSYWHPYWGYWGWGYGPVGPVVYSDRAGYGMGAIDLKVRPKSTEIYVDGQYVGIARQYDGFPGHLWLEKGVYEISFYKPGFETQSRTVKVLNRLVLDMEIDMLEGEAVKPELRLERRERQETGEEVVSRLKGTRSGVEMARLHLTVEPSNALVYLDGNLLGSGAELADLHAGLMLSAGVHTLEVEREGYATVRRELIADADSRLELAFTLDPIVDGDSR